MAQKVERVLSVIGTAGHVDHGKSTLVRALTGIETDRLAEEKRRGVSIELGFAHIDFDLAGDCSSVLRRAAIVDVPGHERFLNTMLRGATGFDAVLLVVAADDGVMPQTVEHLDILNLLGLSFGVVVISKIDLVTEARVAEVEAEVRGLLCGTRLEGAAMVRYSSVGKTGLKEIRECLSAAIQRLKEEAGAGHTRPSAEEFFRLPVDRSFPIKGFGTVVTGTVASGVLKEDEGVETFPQGRRLKLRGIESLGAAVAGVERGERAALNLSGIGYKELSRGMLLTSAGLSGFTAEKKRLKVDVSVRLLKNLAGVRRVVKVKNGALLKLHHLTGSALVRIRFSDRRVLMPGESVLARLSVSSPLLLLRGDGFVLRDPATNSTIGGGTVSLPYIDARLMPPHPGTILPPYSCSSVGTKEDIALVLKGLMPAGRLCIEVSALSVMLNIKEGLLVERVAKQGRSKGGGAALSGFTLLNTYVVNVAELNRVRAAIRSALEEFYLKDGTGSGMAEELLCKGLTPQFSRGLGLKRIKEVFKSIIDKMIAGNELVRRQDALLCLPEQKVRAGSADTEVEEAVLAELNGNGLKVKPVSELVALPFSTDRIKAAVRSLKRSGSLVEIKRDGYLSASVVKEAEERLRGFLAEHPSIEAKEFRDSLGCGRKLAIEILEYFDRVKVTLRRGDERILR